jgi:hypothetical protein
MLKIFTTTDPFHIQKKKKVVSYSTGDPQQLETDRLMLFRETLTFILRILRNITIQSFEYEGRWYVKRPLCLQALCRVTYCYEESVA